MVKKKDRQHNGKKKDREHYGQKKQGKGQTNIYKRGIEDN